MRELPRLSDRLAGVQGVGHSTPGQNVSGAAPLMTNGLGSRMERALALAAESRLAHVRLLPGNPLGVAVRHWQQVSATLVRHDAYYYPHFNAIRGLSPGDESTLDEALGWFRDNQRACSVVVSTFHGSERLLHHMAGRGLRQSRFMTVLYGVPESTRPLPAAEVTVHALRAAELDLFLTLCQAGAADTNGELLKPVGEAEFADWRCYVASSRVNRRRSPLCTCAMASASWPRPPHCPSSAGAGVTMRC